MNKMKVSFTIKVTDEFEITPREVQNVNALTSQGESLLKIDELKKVIAEALDINTSCVEVLEHSEIVVEGKGE